MMEAETLNTTSSIGLNILVKRKLGDMSVEMELATPSTGIMSNYFRLEGDNYVEVISILNTSNINNINIIKGEERSILDGGGNNDKELSLLIETINQDKGNLGLYYFLVKLENSSDIKVVEAISEDKDKKKKRRAKSATVDVLTGGGDKYSWILKDKS